MGADAPLADAVLSQTLSIGSRSSEWAPYFDTTAFGIHGSSGSGSTEPSRSAFQLFVPADRFDELRRRDLASVDAELRGEGKSLTLDELLVGVPAFWVTAVGAAKFQPRDDLASIPAGDRTARELADRAEFRRSAAVGRTRVQWIEDDDLVVSVDSRVASVGLNDAFEFGATLEFSAQLTRESSS